MDDKGFKRSAKLLVSTHTMIKPAPMDKAALLKAKEDYLVKMGRKKPAIKEDPKKEEDIDKKPKGK
jgi:hypothetical protein